MGEEERVNIEDRTVIRSDEEGDPGQKRKKYRPPYVVVVDGPRVGQRFPLKDGANIIGRAMGLAVRLDDQSVSRQHAEIIKSDTGWSVRDLGSKNGTFVNMSPVADVVVVGHKDLIKVGIYLLRLVTQEVSLEEEMTLPQEYVAVDRTMVSIAAPESTTGSYQEDVKEDEEAMGHDEAQRVEPVTTSRDKKRKFIIYGAGALVVLMALVYFGFRFFSSPDDQSQEEPELLSPPLEEEFAEETEELQPLPEEAVPPAPQLFPVFLDFVSSPMTAEIEFQEKMLGATPLRVNVELEPGQSYNARAHFEMPEIKESFAQDVEFTVDPTTSVIPILFRAPVGMVRVDNLPRDVKFYLEGSFEYDRFHAQHAKLDEIVLRKPIYIPFGKYILELRRARKLSETSETFVQDIIYRREFQLGTESPTYLVSVADEDLQVFPVEIRSDPPGADVFIDGQRAGKTPYNGLFPLGEHQMGLRKDGYFEHRESLKVDINTPFVTQVKLKTSIAGSHLNKAKAAMNRAMYQEAINELAEALAGSPAGLEIAEANYLLGKSYLQLGDTTRALGYFEKAKEHEEMRYLAMLGQVQAHAMSGESQAALPILVEVMLKGGDNEEVKREANTLFQKISPFRSVLYVYSEPPGADVVVNDKLVGQKTPVILHELPLGNYRLRVEKTGYLPTELNMSLSVNEFNPVVVKLKRIPE